MKDDFNGTMDSDKSEVQVQLYRKKYRRLRRKLELNEEMSDKDGFLLNKLLGESKSLSLKLLNSQKELTDVCRLVQHDVSAPLATLRMLERSLSSRVNPIEANMLRSVSADIEGILKDLSKRSVVLDDDLTSKVYLPQIIKELFLEKQQIFKVTEFKIKVGEGFSSMIRAPRTGLRRVLSNLINNACEACRGSKSCVEISVDQSSCKSKVVLVISDNGCGIPEEIQDKIWDKDFTFSKANGMGLGLSFVRSCICAWNGKIKLLSSKQNEGSSFLIELPSV